MALSTPDQSAWTPIDTGGQMAEAPEGTTPDGIFTFASAESPTGFVRRVVDGTYRASWAGVFADGVAATNASRLNAVFSSALVKEVLFDTPEGGDVPLSGTLTIPSGKILNISGGSAFTGTYTIVNATIKADYNQVIFKGTPTLTNPKSSSGKFSVNWWGALPDGNDISASLVRCSTAVATSFQKNIFFPGSENNYVISSNTSINNNIIMSFDNGAILSGAGALNGGMIDAGYSQQICTSDFLINPNAGFKEAKISVKWFGALGNNSNDDYPAIQAAINTVVRNTLRIRTVWFPSGLYRISAPLIAANWDGTRYQFHTTFFEGETSMWPNSNTGARIFPQFRDTFALGIQAGKGCKVISLGFYGQFTPPAVLPNYAFYSLSFEEFTDGVSRDSTYSPYSGIVVDPFSNSAAQVPADGGYPGLTSWYRGTGGVAGSTAIEMTDVVTMNFVVGIIISPNGFTRNAEIIRIHKWQVQSVKAGVAGTQEQEKTNVVDTFAGWGGIHTLITVGLYGAGTPGHWKFVHGNLAGSVNRLIYNNQRGYFPSFIEDIYAESLGSVGFIASITGFTGKDCDLNFVYLTESKMTQWQLQCDGGSVKFIGGQFRIYGTSMPVCILGDAQFDGVSFNTIPYVLGNNAGNTRSSLFTNCIANGFRFGSTGIINNLMSGNTFTQASAYGSYTLFAQGTDASGLRNGYVFNGASPGVLLSGGTYAVTITGANRVYSFTVPLTEVYKYDVNRIVTATISSVPIPVGIVTAINAGTGEITVSYAAKELVDGSYFFSCYQPLFVAGMFIGNTTSASANITNIKFANGTSASVLGFFIRSNVHGANAYVKCMSYDAGTETLTVSNNASVTQTGAWFANDAIQVKNYSTANGTLAQNILLQRGSSIKLASLFSINGLVQDYIVSQSGYLDPSTMSDTRRAYIMPINVFQYNNNPEGVVSFPSGSRLINTTNGDLYIKSTTSSSDYNGGNTGWVRYTQSSATVLTGSITGNTSVTIPNNAVATLIKTSSTTTQSGLLIGITPGGSEIDTVSYTGSATAGSSTATNFRGTGANAISFTNISGTVNYQIILQ